MNGKLCSEPIRALVEQIDIALPLSVVAERSRQCLKPLADQFHFGKMVLHLVAPASS